MHSEDIDTVPEQAPSGPVLWQRPEGAGKRWVDDTIADLDPETDYARIVSLIANYKLNDFVMNINYCVGFMSNVMPSAGSNVVAGTGKAASRPQTRYYDTLGFFWLWFIHGPDNAKVKQSLVRLNRFHARLYEQYPDSFRENDDWLFTTANLGCGADRMRDIVGSPRQPEHVQTAWHHFWRDITAQMQGMEGPVHSFPDTYEELLDFAADFENREYPPTPDGKVVCDAMVAQFNERFLPRPLHALGRTFILAFVSPAVIRRHGLKPPSQLGVWVVRRAFRALFFGLDHFIPDNKVPMIEVLNSDEYQNRRRSAMRREKVAASGAERSTSA